MRRCVSAGLLVVGVMVACGDERDAFDVESPPAFGVDAGGGADAAVPDCMDKVRCSRDLHAVVDACDESRVVQTCPPDQACGEGACRPACDPVVSANGSTGCEFIAIPPAPEENTAGSCFSAFITNTWGTPTRIEAEYDGKALDLAGAARTVRTNGADVTYDPFTGELQPGEVAVLFLSQSPVGFAYWTPCPDGVTPAVMKNTGKSGTGRAASFRLKTTAPVSAYSLYPFGGATSYVPSASLLLPVASWKTSYIVTGPWEKQPLSPTTGIVAAEDDTEVTVIGSKHILSGYQVDSAEKGIPHVYKLRRGEHLQFMQELTGTRVTSNKKIGVWSGHEGMAPPRAGTCCADSEQLQLLPVSSWGHHYVVVPYLSRSQNGLTEEYFFRLTGAVDGTVLTYEPSRPREAPETLSAGESVLIRTTEPFIVSSQDGDHPFATFSYMTGEQWASAVLYDGDPEFTFVVPTEQYLGHYVFFVDPTYRNSQLVIVRAREPGKDFAPVRLDCAGPLDGWQPIGTTGEYEYTRIRLTKDFEPQQIGNGTCSAGRHEIDSASPLAVTVWGTDAWSSYGYPSGAALRTLNKVDLVVK